MGVYDPSRYSKSVVPLAVPAFAIAASNFALAAGVNNVDSVLVEQL